MVNCLISTVCHYQYLQKNTILTEVRPGRKAFIKPFEAPQRSVKIKIQLNLYFNTAFRNEQAFKG